MRFYHLFRLGDDTAVEWCGGFHTGLYFSQLKKNQNNKPNKNLATSQFECQRSEAGVK